ncbi:MAG: hypothetical protein AABY14_01910 [Nanoarchaeota archaeon]
METHQNILATNFINSGGIDIVNSKKKGSFLEWIIKRIFQITGFYATNKAIINYNQIDVFVNYSDIKIIVQCKQYEKSTPPIINERKKGKKYDSSEFQNNLLQGILKK